MFTSDLKTHIFFSAKCRDLVEQSLRSFVAYQIQTAGIFTNFQVRFSAVSTMDIR